MKTIKYVILLSALIGLKTVSADTLVVGHNYECTVSDNASGKKMTFFYETSQPAEALKFEGVYAVISGSTAGALKIRLTEVNEDGTISKLFAEAAAEGRPTRLDALLVTPSNPSGRGGVAQCILSH